MYFNTRHRGEDRRLDTRIVLLPVGVFRVEIAPCRADIVEGRVDLDLVRCLEELCGQTVGHVPCDVTMHDPSTGIVRLEGKNEPPSSWQHCCIAARRVIEVQFARLVVCVDRVLFRTQHVEVMSEIVSVTVEY